MESHLTLDDQTFERQFAEGTLDPKLFNHEAHLRLAWIQIRKYGVERAIENCCAQIRTFAKAQGATDKFHITVTVAAVRAVDHFIRKRPVDTFQDFIQIHPKLKYNFRELLSSHYATDIFQSPEARRKFLAPDLSPFT